MGIAEKIALLTSRLPPDRQAEVLDFVEFLAVREAGRGSSMAFWTDEAFSILSLSGLTEHETDDPVTYELSDCIEKR